MALKKSKTPHSTLKKANEVLKKGLEKGKLSEVQQYVSTELFNVLHSSPIPVDLNLCSTMYSIQNNLAKIKNKDFVEDLTNDIKFDAAISINSVEIKNTGDLPHQDATTTRNSIKQIEDSQTELSSLEGEISTLKDRFNNNIGLLRKIADEQSVLRGNPRGLDDIDEDLNKYGTIKDKIGKRIAILSDIINVYKQNNEGGDESATSEGVKQVLPKGEEQLVGKLLDDFNAINVSDIWWDVSEDFSTRCAYSITSIGDLYEIEAEQKNYISLSEEIDKRIKELEHEKALRELVDSLEKEKINIPDGFLPFSSTDTVAEIGYTHEETLHYINKFEKMLRQLDIFKKEIKKIHKRYNTNKNNLKNILTLQEFHEKMNSSTDVAKCQKELATIIDICKNNLLLGTNTYRGSLGEYAINLGGGLESPIELNFINGPLPSARSFIYSLCDEKGDPIAKTGKGFSISKFQVEGISFDDANQTMTISDLKTDPIEGVKFPLSFDLNVKVNIKDNDTNLNVEHYKPLHLTINPPKLPQANRKNAYESITDPTMDKRIEEKYDDKYRENLENEIIWKIVRKGGNKSEVNKIYNDELKRDLFIERIRKRLQSHFPFLKLDKLTAGFKTYMTKESKDVPIQYLINEAAFKSYISACRENDLKDYATEEIEKSMSNDHDIIDSILLSFYGSTQVSNGYKRRSSNNSYTKLLVGKEKEGSSASNKVKIEVQGINRILATITPASGDEEKIEAQSHDQLIEYILDKKYTKDGTALDESTRCQLALCVLKAMIKISPQRLSKQIPNKNIESLKCNRIEIDIDGSGNLRYRGIAVDTKTQNKEYVNIFDESTIDWSKTNEIKNHIQMISMQINNILNGLAQNYQEATNAKNIENMFLLRYNTTERLRTGAIKKLWARTNYNFDFDEVKVIDLHGNEINISFKEGKFAVEGELNGKNYKYEAKDLGYIIRQGGEMFYGLELEIFRAINEKYVEQLRTNRLIQKENFAIADLNENRTGRVYIYDSGGHLSYLEIADQKLNPLGSGKNVGRIDSKNIPGARTICTADERKEFFQNPLLAGRLLREMRKMLRLFTPRKISEPKAKSTKKTGVLKDIGDRFSTIGKKFDSLKPKH